jgi:hypothetical protein
MRQLRFTFTRTALALACAAAIAPASAATLSVGAGKTYATPCQAFAAAKSGDIVEITGNATYSGDVCGISASNLTIRGVNGRPKIDAAGKNAMGKATWVVQGSNIVIENVEMYGAKVPDQNGAALRLEGTNFTLRSSYLHDNENGILSGANTASNILIEYSEFARNGYGDGYSHNLYIGNVGSLTFRYNYSHDANVGHNLKSRARVNTIAYNRFSSTPAGQEGARKPSYEVDLPNAGTAYVIGNVIQQPASSNNPALLAFGEEGASNPTQDLYVINNTFLNEDSSRGTFIMIGGGVSTPARIQNNIFGGVGTMSTQASSIDKTNYRNLAPAFVNRTAYDLRPTLAGLVIDAGSDPGTSAAGVSLKPVAQYRHVAGSETRPAGILDIGAYEAAATVSTAPAPAPAPAPEPAPTPSADGWTRCAAEGGVCSFTGTRQVRYGVPGYYNYKTVTGSTPCTNAVFGDPKKSTAKYCDYANSTTTTTAPAPAPTPTAPTTETWTFCANENGVCSFSGTREVRYGVTGYFFTKVITGSTPCTNAVFGDPKKSTAKACYFSSVTR